MLRIWCISFDLPCWCIHLSDLSVDQEMARKQRRERRLKEGSQNGRYYHYINCNHLAWVGSERINQTFLRRRSLLRRRFRKQQESKNKVFRRSGDWKKDVEDFRNALRALCKYRNECIEWIGWCYCKGEFEGK